MQTILFINNEPFNPIAGGIERVTDILSRELINRKYKIHYLCGNLGSFDNKLLDYNFPAEIHFLPKPNFFRDNENIEYFIELIHKCEIDCVINQRGIKCYWPDITIPHYCFDKKVLIINVLHSAPQASLIEIVRSIKKTDQPWAKRLFKFALYPFFSAYWRARMKKRMKIEYKEMAKHSDAIVTLSNEYTKYLQELIVNEYNAKLISIPNPTLLVESEIIPFDKKEKLILWVGRLDSEKNPIRMLRIWKRIQNQHKDWQLYVIGDGKEKEAVYRFIKQKNLTRVKCTGRISNVQLFYQKASFVLLTSDYEGFPCVLTEAISNGCIPFTFDNYGAARDIIDEGINGCLIKAFNEKEYANRLSELMNDEGKRFKMGKAALEKAKEFSIEKVITKWETLFQNLNKKDSV